MNYEQEPQGLSGGAKFAILLILLIVLVAIGVGIYFYINNTEEKKDEKKDKKIPPTKKPAPMKVKPVTSETSTSTMKTTGEYDSKPTTDPVASTTDAPIASAPVQPAGILAVANFAEGKPVTCKSNSSKGSGVVYRYVGNNTLRHYPNPEIAASCDSNWSNVTDIEDCTGLKVGADMPLNLNLGSSVPPGTEIRQEQYLISNNGQFKLIMQSDGNLVMYRTSGGVKWATGTENKGTGPYKASYQGDGNFVVYSSSGATWATNTENRKSTGLIMQDDGNLVIYNGGSPVWACCG